MDAATAAAAASVIAGGAAAAMPPLNANNNSNNNSSSFESAKLFEDSFDPGKCGCVGLVAGFLARALVSFYVCGVIKVI